MLRRAQIQPDDIDRLFLKARALPATLARSQTVPAIVRTRFFNRIAQSILANGTAITAFLRAGPYTLMELNGSNRTNCALAALGAGGEPPEYQVRKLIDYNYLIGNRFTDITGAGARIAVLPTTWDL